jgi:hypothetical protein|tara:strand:+ start:2010 stop:3038 length:1029 start_codon:yes stop_codon:yes gene_type:complete
MAYISFQPNDYFNTKIYTGTGSSNALTGVGFQPDWTWIKRRNATASHAIQDAVRGNDKSLRSNTTGAEYTNTFFSSFDTDGFTVTSSESDVNASAETYASWNWKANGSGSSNTDGTTSSTVSVNTTAGFSIVKWTGSGSATTIGHGIGVTPKIIMLKNTSEVYGWQVYHASLGNTKYLALDSTDAEATSSESWNNTSPTSTVFSVGASDSNNKSGNTIIAYCFAEKKGFSKFGSYVGNGSTWGTFVNCGFKPAWIMLKDTNSGSAGWMMFDNKRLGYNVDNNALYPNATAAEGTGDDVDLLSNGFKARSTDAGINTSGNSYIYMCFAEEPIVSSNGVPAVAR